MDLYFAQQFGVDEQLLVDYGALNISVVSDLPLFVDPFLLFNSDKPEYQQLHEDILKYLRFLKEQALPELDEALIKDWYCFGEVRQNWFGYTLFGNDGAGLGLEFATALHEGLGDVLSNFGQETITQSSHLEKLCLIRPGVGKDNISDFTTNLIKGYLLDYTQTFAKKHLDPSKVAKFPVPRAAFNYKTKTWETRSYILPKLMRQDLRKPRLEFVLLTPVDMLTKDDTWISHKDMLSQFELIPDAIPNDQLRAQVNRYFKEQLGRRPSAKERAEAAMKTIRQFPELLDRYIRLREDSGERAEAVSAVKVEETKIALIEQVGKTISDLEATTDFYEKSWTSYEECLERVGFFKHYIENGDGYKLLNRGSGEPFSNEKEVQLAFGLVWCNTDLDVNREANNGRGPVDFKASYGAGDKSLIEFKLGGNKQLKRNLEKQVAIYEAANGTRSSVKAIVCYTASQERRVAKILKELHLQNEKSVVVIDARNDNKPSASTA
jgi:K+/H+ antiporter YhaU regulatory subunit KhtT